MQVFLLDFLLQVGMCSVGDGEKESSFEITVGFFIKISLTIKDSSFFNLME